MTNHSDTAGNPRGVPPAAAGDTSFYDRVPDNEIVTKTLHFNREDYMLKAAGTRLSVQVMTPGQQVPDTTAQQGLSGQVYDAAIADLDADRQPEIYSFTKSDGADHYRSVFAIAFRGRQSFPVQFTDITPATNGYNGQDTFFIDSARRLLVRQYPVTDSASKRATGKMQTIRYALSHDGDVYHLLPVKQ